MASVLRSGVCLFDDSRCSLQTRAWSTRSIDNTSRRAPEEAETATRQAEHAVDMIHAPEIISEAKPGK